MNPIDNETLKAIGGQKALEAASSFADTMMRLHQIRKEAELIDLQVATGKYDFEEKKASETERREATQAGYKADIATSKAKEVESKEFVSVEATKTRADELKLKTEQISSALKLLPKAQQLEADTLANQLREQENIKFSQNIQQISSMSQSQFVAWKKNNPELINELSTTYPEIATLMNKPLTSENRTKLMDAWAAIQPEVAQKRVLMELEQKYRLEALRAELEAKADGSDKRPSIPDNTQEAMKYFDGQYPENIAVAATNVVRDINTAMINSDRTGMPMYPQSVIFRMVDMLAKKEGDKSLWSIGTPSPETVMVQGNLLMKDLQRGQITPHLSRVYGISEEIIKEKFAEGHSYNLTDLEIMEVLEEEYGED